MFSSYFSIPDDALKAVWEALTVPEYDDQVVKAKLAKTTSRPLTLDDLKAAIAKAPTGSVRGSSRLSYAMMKAWTPKVRHEAFGCMTIMVEAKMALS